MEMEVPIENNSFSGDSGTWLPDSTGDNHHQNQNQNQGHTGGGPTNNSKSTSSISNNKNFLFNHQDGNRFVEQSGLHTNIGSSRFNRRERISIGKESKDYRKNTTSSTIITPNISQIKIAIVGDSTTGKSTICHRLLSSSSSAGVDREGQNFSPKYQMTIGVSVVAKSMKIPNAFGQEEGLNLILLDSSGKDIYVDLLPKYWEKLNAVAVVFDITSQNSLTNALAWLELAKSSTFQQEKFPGVLIGNKTDLEDQRTVSSKMAHEFATQNNIQYFECSAKDGRGMDEPFYYLTHQCYSMSLNEKN